MIIIETGFPRERANSPSARRNRTALRLRRRARRRRPRSDYEPQTTQFSKSVPSSHVGVGSKTGFHIGKSPARKTGRLLHKEWSLKLQIRNRGSDSAAKRREGIISDLLLSQTQTQPQPLSIPLSMPPPPAKSQSASEPTSESGRSIGI